MKHHAESNSHCKQILKDVISLSMLHIDSLMQKIRKLDITDVTLESKTQQEKDLYQQIANTLTIINDCIHPAHNIAKELFPKAQEFITYCQENQHRAIASKTLPDNCNCYSCKTTKPL